MGAPQTGEYWQFRGSPQGAKGSKSHTGIHSTRVLQLAACTYQQVARSLCILVRPGNQSEASYIYQSTTVANLPEDRNNVYHRRINLALVIRSGEACETPSKKAISPRSGRTSLPEPYSFPGGAVVKHSLPEWQKQEV